MNQFVSVMSALPPEWAQLYSDKNTLLWFELFQPMILISPV
jgi:hypothetical protein